MKNGLVKLACLFTMLALVLTGCSMIEIDPVKQHEEDMEALYNDYSNVIVSYDGGQITKGDMMADYYFQFSYLTSMYSMYYGTTLTEDDARALANYLAQGYVNTAAVLMKAEELGIALTEEEIAECNEYAETNWQDAWDSAYATAEGETEEERTMATEHSLATQGVSYEYYYNQCAWDMIVTKTQEHFIAEAPELTEDELRAALAEQVMEDEKTYSADLTSFERNMVEGTALVTWMPSGYRTVKHILLVPETEVLDAYIATRNEISTVNGQIASLNTERLEAKNGNGERSLEDIEADIAAKQAELDELNAKLADNEAACIANVQEQLDDAYARLEAGEDFDAVMAELGQDPGMEFEPSKTTGYYVCGASETWDYSFRNGAMALENVGDYSAEPIVSASGVHVIYYVSDVTPGPVALDDIREEFTAMAQENANAAYFNELTAQWAAALNPQYNIDNFFKAGE